MPYRKYFSKRIKQLRTAHKLTGSQFAELLQIKSKVSISQFESGTSSPIAATLVSISNFFAVSLDWLVLPLSQPYNEEKISLLEKKIYEITLNIPVMSDMDADYYAATWFLRDPIGQYYLNPATRSNYSLATRANILYCLYVLLHFSSEHQTGRKYPDLCEKCRKILEDYIVHKRNITVPVFDITKEPT